MIIVKSSREIELIREASRIVALVFEEIKPMIKAGVSTKAIDDEAGRIMAKYGATSGSKGYYGYPGNICISVNETSVHGIPSERIIFKVPMPKLKDGDLIISRNDAIETYQFSPQPDWMATSRNQDRMFHQGKILFVSGVPPGEASVFVVLNLETRERERIIDFKKNGLTTEPESIFIWQGDICVAFVDKIVKLYL